MACHVDKILCMYLLFGGKIPIWQFLVIFDSTKVAICAKIINNVVISSENLGLLGPKNPSSKKGPLPQKWRFLDFVLINPLWTHICEWPYNVKSCMAKASSLLRPIQCCRKGVERNVTFVIHEKNTCMRNENIITSF